MDKKNREVRESMDIREENFRKVKEVVDYLTNHPEISGEEIESSNYLMGFLKEQGYEVTGPCGEMPYSFLAVPENRKHISKKAALLCEYDALPDVGHACGHSLSCGCSILAGLILNQGLEEENIPLRVDLIGTPGEEFVGGKVVMADHGVFDDYEFAAMIHMNNEDQTCFRVLACNDQYITFHGKASHASSAPEEGLNALNGARLFMDAMDMWRQHLPKDCQIHGIVDRGGSAPNVIPDTVCLNYYFRAETMEHLILVNEKAKLSARGAAMATGTTVEFEQKAPTYGEIFCSDRMDQLVKDAFAVTGRDAKRCEKAGGSSDAGNVDFRIPVFHPMLDITNHHKEYVLHDKSFESLLHTEAVERGLADGAAILTEIVHTLAENPELLEKIQEEHRAYRKL